MSSNLDEIRLLQSLNTQWFGRSLQIVDECTSTNDLAKTMAENGAPHGHVVFAETQTAGRGRLGKSWLSPRGGLWLSVLLRAPMVPGFLESLPLVGALAITRTLRQEYVVNATVRWPNDVVVDWQKIAGVLVESKTKGNELLYAILGLGINANFDTEAISPTGVRLVSLLALLGAPVNREHLIAMVLSETEKVCGSLQNSENDVIAQLRELDCSRGHRVRVKLLEREIAGTVEDYETLSKVRIRSRKGVETVETDELVSVDYQSD